MEGEAERLQLNAFESWRRLAPSVEVVLVGSGTGLAETARAFGFLHLPQVRTNRHGTPLVSDAIAQTRNAVAANLLLYSNADIIFTRDLLEVLQAVRRWSRNRFVGMGQRWESDLQEDFRDWSEARMADWIADLRRVGRRASIVCKDYFLFPRHLYLEIPDFAVGRGNWDNWMIYQAHRQGVPVVDLSRQLTAIHQPHGHRHCGGRRQAYVVGEEAVENQRLAGGRHLVLGSHASHFLDEAGQMRPMGLRWLGRATADAPRFLELLKTLLRS
jgi:hypothetical protein